MRICSVKCENINSLAGNWELDFEDPRFGDNLFALSGPTGAGKSTVWDAITLALYGRTVRQSVAPQNTEVITHGKNFCRSEVVFACDTSDGREQRYRCSFCQQLTPNNSTAASEIKRALKPIDAQGAQVAWSDGSTEVITAAKTWKSKVEELIGLNFEQFTKAVLLAQGNFAEFLKAAPSLKAEILESLTDSEIYSLLGKQCFQEWKIRENTVKELKTKIDDQECLDEQNRLAKERELQNLRESAQGLSDSLSQVNSAKQILESVRDKRKEREDKQASHKKAEEGCAQLQRQRDEAQTELETRHKNLLSLQERQKRLEPVNVEANRLGERLERYSSESQSSQEELSGCRNRLTSLKESLEHKTLELTELHAGLEKFQEFFCAHSQDAELMVALSGLQSSYADWLERSERLPDLARKRADFDTACSKAQQELQKQENSFIGREEAVQALRSELAGEFLDGGLPESDDEAKQVLEDRLNSMRDLLRNLDDVSKDALNFADSLRQEEERRALIAESGSQLQAGLVVYQGLEEQKRHNEKQLMELEERLKDKKTIGGLMAERAQLTAGCRCPLCLTTVTEATLQGLPADATLKSEIVELERKIAAAKEEGKRIEGSLHKAALANNTLENDGKRYRAESEAWQGEQQKRLNNLNGKLSGLSASRWQGRLDELRLPEPFSAAWRDWINDVIKRLMGDITAGGVKLRQRKESFAEAVQSLNTERDELSRARQKLEFTRKDRDNCAANYEESRQQLQIKWQAMALKLNTYGSTLAVEEQEVSQAEAVLQALSERAQAWKNNENRKAECLAQCADLEKSLASLNTSWAKTLEEENSLDKKLQQAKLALNEVGETVRQLYQNSGACLALPPAQDKADAELLQELSGQILSFGVQVQAAEEEFRSQSQLVAQMDVQISAGRATSDSLQREIYSINDSLNQLEQRWRVHLASGLSVVAPAVAEGCGTLNLCDSFKLKQKIEILQGMLAECQSELADTNQRIGELSRILEEDKKHRASVMENQDRLKEAEKELAVWRELNDLIGSAGGDKFRRFAQSLTFANLVRLANSYLPVLTKGRNLLSLNEVDSLDVNDKFDKAFALNIVDHFQDDAVRSCTNISGGESFQVSLALSLALSQMASRKMRIDSLFLDEGFGTLDPEALNAALDALNELTMGEQGKLVGIISHVEEVKRRIACCIEVKKESGYSRLKGPGVSELPPTPVAKPAKGRKRAESV